MSLRDIHDFELALVAPLMAMTLRGVKIDEPKRLSMMAALEAQREPLAAKIQGIVLPLLAEAKRLPKVSLFKTKWTCPCCRGGKVKALECWSCAGYQEKPSRSLLKATDTLLTGCEKCGGIARREDWRFNPASPKQVKIVLYNLLKLPKRLKKKKLVSDEEALKSLVIHDKSGFVTALLEITKTTTILRMLKRMQGDEHSRLRTSYNPAGTETGRLSSSETFLFPSTNLQNLSSKVGKANPLYNVKKCVVPDEGMVWLQADLSQAEARVVAALANDTKLLARWEDPTWDCHKFTASIAMAKPEAKVSKTERNILGKKGRHALNYGVGAYTFTNDINKDADITGFTITKVQSQQALDRLAREHPQNAEWWRRVNDALNTTASITTCFGRKRTFFARRRGDRWLDPAHLEAIAFEPQSTVADLLNKGLLNWWTRHEGVEGSLMLQIHDAIIVQCKPGNVPRVAKLLKDCLQIPITVNNIELLIPADVEIMRECWGEAEDYSC